MADAEKVDKEITLDEFRAWLQGVEEMQEDDWAPNKTQWTKIRNKIDHVKAPTVATPITMPSSPFGILQPPNAMTEEPESSLDAVHRRAPSPPQSPIVMNPDAPVADGRAQVKTPNIDTQNGEYESSFE